MGTHGRVLACVCVWAGVLVLGVLPAAAFKGYVVTGRFGSPGSGDGQFERPEGVAVDDSEDPLLAAFKGDVYVADGENSRVERFAFSAVTRVAEYRSQFDGSETPGKAPLGGIIAVDDSASVTDPSAGDVYVSREVQLGAVVDKFTPEGKYVSQLTGREACAAKGGIEKCEGKGTPVAFAAVHGLAVDGAGDVWVYEGEGGDIHLDEFSALGVFIESFTTGYGEGGEGRDGVAVDSAGGLYAGVKDASGTNSSGAVAKFSAGTGAKGCVLGGPLGAPAVDAATNSVFVDIGGGVEEFGPFGEPCAAPLETFPREGLSRSAGIAVSVEGDTPGTATVFATEEAADVVVVMQFVERPEPVTGGPSGQAAGEARLNGSVNPLGIAVSACEFEYTKSKGYEEALQKKEEPVYEGSVPCEEPDAAGIGAGNAPVAVHALLKGLVAGERYDYRLKAANTPFGAETGGNESLGPPQVTGEAGVGLGGGCARLTASVDPENSPTSYHFEYGVSTGYGSSTPPQSAGAGRGLAGVAAQVCGLAPQGTYHFRLAASNASGTTEAPDAVLVALAGAPTGPLGLPDGRVYEQVSPPSPDAEVYVPEVTVSEGLGRAFGSQAPFQVTPDGDGVVYAGSPSGAGGNGNEGNTGNGGNEFLARRCVGSQGCPANGWEAQDIQPPGFVTPDYEGYTPSLQTGFLNSTDLLSPLAPGEQYDVLYEHAPGSETYTPLFTTKPKNRGPGEGEFGTAGYEYLGRHPVLFAGATEDGSQVLFEANDALLKDKELEEDAEHDPGNFLYESVEGSLSLVDVLPGGKVAAGASFGAANATGNPLDPPDFSNVISRDGSRVFWSDSAGEVFVRENGTTTVQVSGGRARYWTATPDGAYAFYSEHGELYRFSVEAKKREALAASGLKGENAEVQGVIGTSEDGESVYFIAEGELAAGAARGQPNLYLHSAAGTVLVATLTAGDNDNKWIYPGSNSYGVGDFFGDWQPALGKRTAQVTPDGGAVVFVSQARLATVNFPGGYDNAGCSNGKPVGCTEVYVYEAGAGGGLYCVSCAPDGAPPPVQDPDEPERASFVPVGWSATSQMRWVSDSGGRVFFDSYEPLTGRDSNGTLDVYEWERDGEGSCGEAKGCVFLLSGGAGAGDNASYLLGSSETGEDVFLATRSQLLAGAPSEAMRLYDARIGGYVAPEAAGCAPAGCPRVPGVTPAFAAPASEAFSGPGNPATPTPTPAPAPAPSRAERLAAALKACRKKDKPGHKRGVCEAHARKAYGAKATRAGKKAAVRARRSARRPVGKRGRA